VLGVDQRGAADALVIVAGTGDIIRTDANALFRVSGLRQLAHDRQRCVSHRQRAEAVLRRGCSGAAGSIKGIEVYANAGGIPPEYNQTALGGGGSIVS
jgi:hypothetical protein